MDEAHRDNARPPSIEIFHPIAPDAVRICSGECGEAKPSTAFPTVDGMPGARRSECTSCRDEPGRTTVTGSKDSDAVVAGDHGSPDRKERLRAHRGAVTGAISEVLKTRSGVAMSIRQIHEEISHLLDFTPSEEDVRRCLQGLAKAEPHLVNVDRNVYSWTPVDVIPPPPPRVVEMIERRLRGETLDEIGAVFGVTRERVRQLLKKHGGPSSATVRQIQIKQVEEAKRVRQEAIEVEVRRILASKGAATVEDVAGETGLDPAEVSKFWPTDLTHLRLWSFDAHESRWSDEEILESIREAAIYEYPLTANAYTDLVAVGQVTGPSLPRIGQRFGTWSAACDAAGVVSGQTSRPHYDSQWGDDDILKIVRRYLEDPAAPNSIHGYDAWKRSHAPDGPSGMTIRNRFRSWTAVKRIALGTSSVARKASTHE